MTLLAHVWRHPLNADGRLRAIGRVLRWQLAARLVPGPIALPFVEGTRLFATRGMTGATGNWYCGLHEAAEMGFLLHLLRPGDLFLDVGANVGAFTVMGAGAVGARVVSVEPIPASFSRLRDNILLNDIADRVEPHRVGLSGERAALRFTEDQDTVNHVMAAGEAGAGVDVEVLPMDELLAGRVPVAIKIDVEGHEREVLRGATRTLAAPGLQAVVMEVNGSGARYGVADAELLEVMRAHGFGPHGYDPVARRLLPWDAGLGHAVFVRDAAALAPVLAGARRYRTAGGTV